MADISKTLQQIVSILLQHELGKAIEGLENLLYTYPQLYPHDQLADLKADYERMVGYWLQGYDDDHRQHVYAHLCRQLYALVADVATRQRVSTTPLLSALHSSSRKNRADWTLSGLRRDLEAFVSDTALLELEPEHTRATKEEQLYSSHQLLAASLFDYVLTSRSWSDSVEQCFEDMLLSPTVDTTDQQLLLSAVTLAAMNIFDYNKFRLLANTYQHATDEAVRQRALVGWALTLNSPMADLYPDAIELVHSLTANKQTCEELAELQMQMVYCMNAETDNQKIQREIMPDLLKNNNFKVTPTGIEETEDDPMEDILHPDAAEQRMEKMEEGIQRMRDMQEAGSDIYFGGFSQMKRYPFFAIISNWFVPFYPQHPAISHTIQQTRARKFMEQLLTYGTFCNSDKYSFVLAFNQVANHLPPSLMQMLERGEAEPASEMLVENASTPAFIRRFYLQDLYRFFKVYPQRSNFRSPFADSCLFVDQPLFRDTPLQDHLPGLAAFLAKRKRYDEASRVLDNYGHATPSFHYYMVRASVALHSASPSPSATQLYAKALELQPGSEPALKGFARAAFSEHDYETALQAYEKLLEAQPDTVAYQLNKAVCMTQLMRYDEAQKILFQLNFDHPDDQRIERVLAWALVGGAKLQQAARIYQRLLESSTSQSDDHLNYAYCLWLDHQVEAAVDHFRQYAATLDAPFDAKAEFLQQEALLLQRHGITPVEVQLMADQLRT